MLLCVQLFFTVFFSGPITTTERKLFQLFSCAALRWPPKRNGRKKIFMWTFLSRLLLQPRSLASAEGDDENLWEIIWRKKSWRNLSNDHYWILLRHFLSRSSAGAYFSDFLVNEHIIVGSFFILPRFQSSARFASQQNFQFLLLSLSLKVAFDSLYFVVVLFFSELFLPTKIRYTKWSLVGEEF